MADDLPTPASAPPLASAQPASPAHEASNPLHTEHEDHPWTIDIPDHPKRTESAIYVLSRKLMNAIVNEASGVVRDFFLGPSAPPGAQASHAVAFQDHHGGGLWVKDAHGWMLLKSLAGMEWSQQFCADYAKVDRLRQMARRLYAAFPESVPAMKRLLGDAAARYPIDAMLSEEINDADGVARWVDSIFNASVPLCASRHTGVLEPGGHRGQQPAPELVGGVHHYPTPITDIQLFKRDDFQLWVMDGEGELAAVTPVGRHGSGDGRVNVAYATPGTKLHRRWVRAHEQGDHLTLNPDHPMAEQAFAAQVAEATGGPQSTAPSADSAPTPAAASGG